MKKLIAICVVLAMATTAVFAEVTVGGVAGGVWNLVEGIDNDTDTSAAPVNTRIVASAQNDDGTFGGYVRFDVVEAHGVGVPYLGFHSYAWWQPIDLIKFHVGEELDGFFGADGSVVGWGYHGGASDYVVNHNYDRREAFFTGFGAFGPALSITPIEGLAINVAVPYFTYDWGGGAGAPINDPYKHLFGQVRYNITDVGEIVFSYTGGLQEFGSSAWTNPGDPFDTTSLYLAFHLTAIEGLDASIGGKYSLGIEKDFTNIVKLSYQDPVYIGFGAAFATGDFGIKARLTAAFGGKYEITTFGSSAVTTDIKPLFELGILPYYDLGIFKVSVDLGFANQDEFNFFVNPYISKSIGGGTFFCGLKLETAKPSDAIVWSIPVALEFAF